MFKHVLTSHCFTRIKIL